MTDLHAHILPGMDDGARTVREGIGLLRAERDGGVVTVALTPHFYPGRTDLAGFVERRRQALGRLEAAAREEGIGVRLVLGAEVAFSPELLELDLGPLCYEGTRTVLVELPWDRYPPYGREVFYRLAMRGYSPLLAHVERYPYLEASPHLLEGLVRGGALAQANAGSVIYGGGARRRVLRMISGGLVHALASDAHSMAERPPLLHEAAGIVARKLGKDAAQAMTGGLGIAG